MSRGKGKAWEAVCNNSRDAMQQNGLCSWLRMHPPVLIKPEVKAIFTGKGPPDWILLHKGTSILGDDKDSRKSPWRTKNIKRHQVKAFELHEKNGGIACILLRMDDYSRWMIPWKELRKLGDKGTLEIQCGILVDKKTGEPIGKKWDEKEAINKKTKMSQMIPYDWLTPLLSIDP